MNNILFLNDKDFSTKTVSSGVVITTRITNISVVMFYSPKCQYSRDLMPLFRKLPTTLSGCIFAIANISKYPNIVNISRTTKMPIRYVPLLILFVNGLPYMEYKGEYTIDNIKQFILDTSNSVYNNIPRETMKHVTQHPDHPVPVYSLGIPIFTGIANYVEFNTTGTKS